MVPRSCRLCVVSFILLFVTLQVAGSVAAARFIPREQLGEAGSVVQYATEVAQLLYPGTPPTPEAVELLRTVLLGLELERVRHAITSGDYAAGSRILANAVHGAEWNYSAIELLQALDGYEPPSEGDVFGAEVPDRRIERLRQEYRTIRSSEFRALYDGERHLSFADLHSWTIDSMGSFQPFIDSRDREIIRWSVLARSPVASLPPLLLGARRVERGEGKAGRSDLVSSYGRVLFERWVVFVELVRMAEVFHQRFRASLRSGRLAIPLRLLSAGRGEALAESIVSLANGALGTSRSNDDGVAEFSLTFERIARRVGGDGWVSLAVFVDRQEMLYTNLNLNHALTRPATREDDQRIVVRLPERVLRILRPGGIVRVRVTCNAPDGYLGVVRGVQVTLSGHGAEKTSIGNTVEFRGVMDGTHLVSAAAKNEEGITIKTAARVVEVEEGRLSTIELAIPDSLVVSHAGERNVDILIQALEENKDRLLRNELEVREYREAQGAVFRDNRQAAGQQNTRRVMSAFANISVGLRYKSEALRIYDRLTDLRERLSVLRQRVPVRIASEGDMRTNLITLIEHYSTENFEAFGQDEYLFMARARDVLEQNQANLQELAHIISTLDDDIRPVFESIVDELVTLSTEYVENYQLVKFTAGAGFDTDFHRLLEDEVLPLKSLFDEVRMLQVNDFIDSYARQVAEVERVVTNREAGVRVLYDGLEARRRAYFEHLRTRLEPLQSRLDGLSTDGFRLEDIARLLDILPFAEEDRRVLPRQQAQFFQLLDTAASRDGLSAVGSPPTISGLNGRIPRALVPLVPALDLFASVDRNVAEARRLRENYDRELRSNLSVIVDVNTPASRMMAIMGKDRQERRTAINQLLGEVGLEYRLEPYVRSREFPRGGEDLLRAACALVGLYIEEFDQRRTRDRHLGRALHEFEPELRVLRSDPSLLDPRSLSRALAPLGEILERAESEELAFPRLEKQMNADVAHRVRRLRQELMRLVGDYLSGLTGRIERMNSRLDPSIIVVAPPRELLEEARTLLAATDLGAIQGLVNVLVRVGVDLNRHFHTLGEALATLEDSLAQLPDS